MGIQRGPEERTIGRAEIIARLRQILESEAAVIAAWLGGSDASGRTDRYSDIDLQVLVEDDAVEAVFARLHEDLQALSPIALRFRFPEPMWHGHSQELLRLRDADPHHFLDLVIMKRSAPDRLLERERHGEPLVLFDREHLIAAVPLDRRAHRARMEKRLNEMRAQVPLLQPLVARAVHRGHRADAAYGYHAIVLRPLVELLRMRYCPDRFDFGPRYLDRDLPAAWREEIERLSFPASAEEILEFQAQAAAHFEELLAARDRGEWEGPQGDAASE